MGLKLIDAIGSSGLKPSLRPVAMVYARKANEDGSHCFPGVEFVAGYLGLGECIVRRHRNELIALGVLEVETEHHGKRVYHKVIAFHAEKLPTRVDTGVSTAEIDTGVSTIDTVVTIDQPNVDTAVSTVDTGVSPTSTTSLPKITSKRQASVDDAPSAASVRSDSSEAIKRCFRVYRDEFRRRFNSDPLIDDGKDGKIFRRLLKEWPEADVIGVIHRFFDTSDPLVQKSSFTVGALRFHAQRLLLQERHPELNLDPRAHNNLTEIQKAMTPRRPSPVVHPEEEFV